MKFTLAFELIVGVQTSTAFAIYVFVRKAVLNWSQAFAADPIADISMIAVFARTRNFNESTFHGSLHISYLQASMSITSKTFVGQKLLLFQNVPGYLFSIMEP
jgi:hypothetical protein